MKKNILILSSSPRKGGNSDTLCDEFMKGAKEKNHDAEKIFLRDKKIGYCLDCGSCYIKNKECPQKDDMKEVLEKMIKADVIVLSTPVYFYTMASQLKTVIDRTVSGYQKISDKDFYFIITAADDKEELMKATIEGLRAFTYCLDNANEKGVIYGLSAWHAGDIKNNKALKEAYEAGANI